MDEVWELRQKLFVCWSFFHPFSLCPTSKGLLYCGYGYYQLRTERICWSLLNNMLVATDPYNLEKEAGMQATTRQSWICCVGIYLPTHSQLCLVVACIHSSLQKLWGQRSHAYLISFNEFTLYIASSSHTNNRGDPSEVGQNEKGWKKLYHLLYTKIP